MGQTKTKRIYLFSPIAPLRTGTADYFHEVLTYFTKEERQSSVIVVDDSQFHPHDVPETYEGIEVVSWRQTPFVPQDNEVFVIFVANNEFHAYCHRVLAALPVRTKDRVISVIHEPSCFMLYNNLCNNGVYGFGPENLIEFGRAQFGDFTPKLVQSLNAGELHWTTEYSWHFQRNALTRSKEVWCHSRYAAHKLLFESRLPADELPKFRVVGHPKMPADNIARDSSGYFVVGCFGWVQRSKRTHAVLEAFSQFVQELSLIGRNRVRCNIVGAVEDPHYRPTDMAAALQIEDVVHTYGYVERDALEQLMGQCSLIFNLRFPSCGETSGTLQRAVDSGIPVVASDYQAFRELGADDYISIDPRTETMEILALLRKSYQAWLDAGAEYPLVSDVGAANAKTYREIGHIIRERVYHNEVGHHGH